MWVVSCKLAAMSPLAASGTVQVGFWAVEHGNFVQATQLHQLASSFSSWMCWWCVLVKGKLHHAGSLQDLVWLWQRQGSSQKLLWRAEKHAETQECETSRSKTKLSKLVSLLLSFGPTISRRENVQKVAQQLWINKMSKALVFHQQLLSRFRGQVNHLPLCVHC